MSAAENRPAWIELSTSEPAASRTFYSALFGWQVEVSPDPQYGGYALARIGDHDVAGIGPQMAPGPTTWNLYLGTSDVDALAERVRAAGGTVVMAPFDVGDQGRMAVFQDPVGAFISAWQAAAMRSFRADVPNTLGWAELNARGIERAIPFYGRVFGWTPKTSQPAEGQPAYTEFQLDGASIAGGMEMSPMVPAEVPSYWLLYFGVDDVDAACRRATATGATEIMAPQDFAGGRFAIIRDPQGAPFGLLKMQTG
jgi:predicted enzyme related to lactoylglutathione lyase